MRFSFTANPASTAQSFGARQHRPVPCEAPPPRRRGRRWRSSDDGPGSPEKRCHPDRKSDEGRFRVVPDPELPGNRFADPSLARASILDDFGCADCDTGRKPSRNGRDFGFENWCRKAQSGAVAAGIDHAEIEPQRTAKRRSGGPRPPLRYAAAWVGCLGGCVCFHRYKRQAGRECHLRPLPAQYAARAGF